MKKFFVKKTYLIEVSDDTALEDVLNEEQQAMPKKKKGRKIEKSQVVVVPAPIKPSIEEIIQHYKTGLPGEDPLCLTCDVTIRGPFTDLNGQIRCIDCGTTYAWMGCALRAEFLTAHGLTREEIAQHYCDMFEYIPLTRMYWQEVHKRMPFGVYQQNSPITQDEMDSFYGWLVKGADRFEKVYEGFNWQGLKREYPPQ